MEAQGKFISQGKLNDWLEELSSRFEVWAPRKEGSTVVYRTYDPALGVELQKKPTESAKHTIFPRSEALLRYQQRNNPELSGKPELKLEMPAEPVARLVFGLTSCDARGFLIFDPVYDGSGTKGHAKDPYYLKRRNSTILVVKACSSVLASCFCNWTGGSPASSEGADVLATEVQDGFLLLPVNERGKAVLDSKLLSEADAGMHEAARASHASAEQALGKLPPAADISKAILSRFDDAVFWEKESAQCISCGACTFLCPTCYCFTITDESAGQSGVRLRSWDACMTPLFTAEASGHNPRSVKANRLRNRMGHKLSYYPSLHEARFACCGCGRCIRSCPSAVDIRGIVRNAIKEQSNG